MLQFTSIYYDNDPSPGRCLDIWMPETVSQVNVLFLIHGGGWSEGRRDQMHRLMFHYIKCGFICVSADYRLSGATILEQLADIRDGLALSHAHLLTNGFDMPFVLYGSSAGGHLALLGAAAGDELFPNSSDISLPKISAVIASCAPVSFEPWDDIFPGAWKIMQQAAGVSFESDPDLFHRLSPATYFDKNLPDLLFLMGKCEHMFPNSLTVRQVDRLKQNGNRANYHIYDNAEHGFFYDVERTAQRCAFRDTLTFLDACTDDEATMDHRHLAQA